MIALTRWLAAASTESYTSVVYAGDRTVAVRQAHAVALMRVDLHLHRQADLQRMLGELMRIERDAHRNALHDLDPVAGGVLRRQQRERGAGAGTEAGDGAVIADLAPVEIGLQRDWLTRRASTQAGAP